MKLTPEEKILKAKTRLLEKSPFYSYLVMNLTCHARKKDSKECPTMAVNQFGHLYYNEGFVETLNMDEIIAVLAHEASHVATLTFQRRKGRDPELWNIATDIAINYMLCCGDFRLPKGVLLPEHDGTMTFKEENLSFNVKDMSAEEIYDVLERHCEGKGKSKNGRGYRSSIQDKRKKSGFADGHLEDDQNPEGESEGDEEGSLESRQSKNDKKWRQILSNAHASAKNRLDAQTNAAILRELGAIAEAQIPWKALLQRFITALLPADYTMRRPGRKSQGCGVYLPTLIREGIVVNVGIDMSGSITDDEYNDFRSEIMGIIKGFSQISLKMIPWASQVEEKDVKTFTRQNIEDLKNWNSDCCGGTTLSSFTDYIENSDADPTAINIIFTDGYVEENPRLPKGKTLVVLNNTENIKTFKGRCEVISMKN